MKYFLCLNLLIFLYLDELASQTHLNRGEVAITSLDVSNDSFTFITTKDITAGTLIYFTDGRVIESDTNAITGEGVILYTSPTVIPRGRVLKYGSPTTAPFTSVQGRFALANSGDNVIVFQGFDATEDTVDRFISAVGFTATMIDGGGTNAVQGLNEGLNLLTINKANSYYQNDSVGQGTVIAAKIHQLVNWKFTDIRYIKNFQFNTAPTFNRISDITLQEDTDTLKIVLRSFQDSDGDNLIFNSPIIQKLSGENLFSGNSIEYVSPRDSAVLRLKIIPNTNGLTRINLYLRDTGENFIPDTVSQSFQVQINSIPDRPSIPAQDILEDSNAIIFVIRNSVDETDVSHFLINNITNGTLKVGSTPILNNQYGPITNDTLKLLISPSADFTGIVTFSATGAIGARNTFLGSDSTIELHIIDVGDSLRFSDANVNFRDSVDITITRNRVDSDSINTVVIDNIINGTVRVGGSLISNGDLVGMTNNKLIVNFKPTTDRGYFTVLPRNKHDSRSVNPNHLDTVKIEVNSLPLIVSSSPDTLFYDFGHLEDTLLLDLNMSDEDNLVLQGARLFFLNNYNKDLDQLKAVGNAKINATYNTDLGLLELKGFDSLSRYKDVLKTVVYSYGSKTSPILKIKDLAFQIQDSIGGWSDTTRLAIYIDRLVVSDLLSNYCINDANMIIDLTKRPRGIKSSAIFDNIIFKRLSNSAVINPHTNRTATEINIPIGQFKADDYLAKVIYKDGITELDIDFTITIHDTVRSDFEASDNGTKHNAVSGAGNSIELCVNSGTNLILSSKAARIAGVTIAFDALAFPAAISGSEYNIKLAFDAAIAIGHSSTAVLQDTIISTITTAENCRTQDSLILSINSYTAAEVLYFDPVSSRNIRITDTVDFCIDYPSIELLANTLPKGGTFQFDTIRNRNIVEAKGRLDSATFTARIAQNQVIRLGLARENDAHVHSIFHRYTDRNNCFAIDTTFLNVNPKPHLAFDISEYDSCMNSGRDKIKISALRGKSEDKTGRWNYRIKKKDNTIITGSAAGIRIISNGITLNKLALASAHGITDLTIIDTSVNLIAEFIDTETGCSMIDSISIDLKAVPVIKFKGTKSNDSVFCANDPMMTLTATYPGFTPKSINTLIRNIETGTRVGLSSIFVNPFNFIPTIAMADAFRFKAATTHRISFFMVANEGCEDTVFRTFTVHALPRPNLKVEGNCLGKSTIFTSLATPPDGGTIIGWQWEFGDGTSSNLEKPSHLYRSPGVKNVKLTAVTNHGCTYDTTVNIIIGTFPQVDFVSSGFTVNSDISFTSLSTNSLGNIDSLIWDFGDGTILKGNTILINTKHRFSEAGAYNVQLTVFSEFKCASTRSKTVNIFKPLFNYPYSENFQDTRESEHGWLIAGTNSSWQLRNIPGLTGNYWASDADQGYNSLENSQVITPIFDFATLLKPMLIFDLYITTTNVSDGLVLQSSVDNENWEIVGALNDSINWYNTSGLSANPGNQPTRQLGWSGNIGSAISPVTVRYPLDKFVGQRGVQFRFAFASAANTSGNKGHFFVGNFFIRDRIRKILSENFSDFSTSTGKIEDDIFEQQFRTGNYRKDLVVLQYPSRFNRALVNPILIRQENMTNTRAFYYGIDQTNIAVIGGNAQKSKPSTADIQKLIAYSLYDPLFEIELTLENNTLKTKIKPLQNISRNMTLFVVSKEEFITKTGLNRDTIKHIVNKFHPDITGLSLKDNWRIGIDEMIDLQIHIYRVEKIEDVSLVVFIQDDDTKEVYQVESLRLQASNNNLVTSASIVAEPVDNFILYPNPTTKILNIKFETVLMETLPWRIYDSKGRLLQKGQFQSGLKMYMISLEDTYSAGIYILEFITKDEQHSNETFIITK